MFGKKLNKAGGPAEPRTAEPGGFAARRCRTCGIYGTALGAGEKLAGAGRLAATAVAVAALAAMAAVDSASAAPAKDTLPSVDTSITKAPDTPALARSADSSASAPAVDTADTALAAGASPLAAIDTLSPAAAGDSGQAGSRGDNIAAADSPLSAPKFKKPAFKDSRLIKSFSANAAYILFFCASLAVILAALLYFLRKRDTRRFLTTTRLSVLDKMVQKGCRHIESNYMNPELSVSAVCRELVTGEAYLDTLFIKEIGIDVHDFIAQVRVNRIKNLLKDDPTADPENIYKQCGFNDRAAADRCFAKLCGGVGMEVYAKSLVSAGKTPEM